MSCDRDTLILYKSISRKPLYCLDFDDFLFLTGHDKCCGEKIRTTKRRNKSCQKQNKKPV